MDPNAAYNTMTDPDANIGRRKECAYALLGWLDGGGFAPSVDRVRWQTDYNTAWTVEDLGLNRVLTKALKAVAKAHGWPAVIAAPDRDTTIDTALGDAVGVPRNRLE